jgi:hypothetical protein
VGKAARQLQARRQPVEAALLMLPCYHIPAAARLGSSSGLVVVFLLLSFLGLCVAGAVLDCG